MILSKRRNPNGDGYYKGLSEFQKPCDPRKIKHVLNQIRLIVHLEFLKAFWFIDYLVADDKDKDKLWYNWDHQRQSIDDFTSVPFHMRLISDWYFLVRIICDVYEFIECILPYYIFIIEISVNNFFYWNKTILNWKYKHTVYKPTTTSPQKPVTE